jgi:hypothetical protein
MHGITHVAGGPDPVPGLLPPIAGTYQQHVLAEPSLIGYWPLDDTGPPAVDHSASHHDLTESAIPPTYGEPGPFSGDASATSVLFAASAGFTAPVDALIDLNSPSSLYWFNTSLPFTFEILANPAAYPASHAAGLMGSYESPGGSTGGLYLTLLPTGAVRMQRANETYDSLAALNLDAWTHLAMSYDGATLRLYFDGEEQLAAPTTAAHSGSGVFRVGVYGEDSTYMDTFHGRLAQAAIYNTALSGTVIATHSSTAITTGGLGDGAPGKVVGIDDNGQIGWVDPKVEVKVNGSPPKAAATPKPPPVPPVPDPLLDWIQDQPFCYDGPTFTVQPNTWTTIPFATPCMERENPSGWVEIDLTDPDAAGWMNVSTPHAITVPHDMPFNLGAGIGSGDWMQVCLRIDNPIVHGTTSNRALRIFETTHQKTVVWAVSEMADGACAEGGATDVFRGPTGAVFASGDTGGLDTGGHPDIFFIPNAGLAYYLNGEDWLPGHAGGNPTLTRGMRLVAQAWHDATVPLDFSCANTGGSYKPHFVVSLGCDRAWGAPWSTWPT